MLLFKANKTLVVYASCYITGISLIILLMGFRLMYNDSGFTSAAIHSNWSIANLAIDRPFLEAPVNHNNKDDNNNG
jgi:hypothetical protein